jgi:hypothetical protein
MQDIKQDKMLSPRQIVKRIGSTEYTVSIHFSQTSNESYKDKLLRLMIRDMDKPLKDVPQLLDDCTERKEQT